MFESNPYIEIWTEYEWLFASFDDVEQHNKMFWHKIAEVKITSISINIPEFSIGDTVMIVDTGKIGVILWYYHDWWLYDIDDLSGEWFDSRPMKDLVKIPNDLLPLLQDNGTTTTNS